MGQEYARCSLPRRFYDESLVLLREFDLAGEVARVQIDAGLLALRCGDQAGAERRLGEAVELAERLDLPDVLFEAAAARALLPGHGPEASL